MFSSLSRASLLISDTFKPITRRKILDSSKLKESADDNFKFHENGRQLSKQVENTVGKGEGAHYEQFLLFPQRFQKACFPGVSKGVIVWERVNCPQQVLAIWTILIIPVMNKDLACLQHFHDR